MTEWFIKSSNSEVNIALARGLRYSLGLTCGITVLSVNQRHLQDARKIDPDASLVVGRKFQNHRGNSVVAPNASRQRLWGSYS